jgi:predicted membrane-bound mannosyltransferase
VQTNCAKFFLSADFSSRNPAKREERLTPVAEQSLHAAITPDPKFYRAKLFPMFLIRQLVCAAWLAASALAAAAATPNIVLITVYTTRADRMGFLGFERGLTPNLDTLARQSVVFTRWGCGRTF